MPNGFERWLWPLVLMTSIGTTHAAQESVPRAQAQTEDIAVDAYKPPADGSLKDDQFSKMVRYGEQVFTHTGKLAPKFVGNDLNCANCHLDAGRLAHSAPLWAAWVKYPAYRDKNKMVNTMEERIQGCFRYSMNGTPPPADSREMKGIMSYAFWLASGAPTGVDLPGRGYPDPGQPAKPADYARGEQVYKDNCALCHGADGQGIQAQGTQVFPPLWGERSYNWGAGMHRINTAAAFIRANMPLGRGGTLSTQDAWDVALYINSHDRPQDPRYNGNVQATKAQHHDHQCAYGASR